MVARGFFPLPSAFDPHRLFLLVAIVREGRLLAITGTATLVAPGVIVTCWHCLSAVVDGGQYVVQQQQPDNTFRVMPITRVTRHPAGLDLAVAAVELPCDLEIALGSRNSAAGEEVWTYGYPLTRREVAPTGETGFVVEPRYLQGYVTRRFWQPPPNLPRTLTLELDMPAPEGLSGAGLFLRGSRNLVGLVYGTSRSYTIEDSATINPSTGETTPESRRIVEFGAAHCVASLWDLCGDATNNRPLREILRAGMPS